jgi:hypothetical protein
MKIDTTTQVREIDRRNNVPKQNYDTDIDKFCRRVYSVFPTHEEQPDEDILAMSITLCVTRLMLGKIARLCGTEADKVEGTQYGNIYQLNLELGDQIVIVYAR